MKIEIKIPEKEIEQLIKDTVKEVLENINIYNDKLPTKYLITTEACSFMRIGKTKLFELKKSGKIPFIREGRKVLFSQNDLEDYMQSITINQKT